MRSMMLHRPDVTELLPDVSVPTLVLSARDDVMGWRPDEAEQTCARDPRLPRATPSQAAVTSRRC